MVFGLLVDLTFSTNLTAVDLPHTLFDLFPACRTTNQAGGVWAGVCS